ncbi:protein kinase [Nocardia sp. NPDC051030]|uniref:serine/threonine-protein kinase n=1 Tax=Nocardia sp. NPDC051030 TaxID=3155162 RepID=UPI003432CDF1
MRALSSSDPEWLGSNHMVAVIGRGSMGRVFLARTSAGRLVAVKQIHRHLADDREFLTRFRREVAAGRDLTGAYTAAVVDSDVESERPWLATEYIDGPDLGTAVRESGPMDLGGLRLLATGLAAALIEIHRAGLIHRDLKPGNVLLTPEGPRVIDFGIAHAPDPATQVTATGAALGSPAYMAPEQAEGRAPTTAADVFSVGVMLAQAATGANPFLGESTPQILYSIKYSNPDTSAVPASVRGLVDGCLAKDPAQRPTAPELLELAGRIPAEPSWPEPVRARIDVHRAESGWWVRTAERDTHNREVLDRLEVRRRTRLRWLAVAVVTVLMFGGGLVGVSRWARAAGHPQPVTDPSFELTTTEWRILDVCKVLDLAVVGKFGTRNGEVNLDSDSDCVVRVSDSANKSVRFELKIEYALDALSSSKPIGRTAGWASIIGTEFDSTMCQRAITTTKEGLRTGLSLTASSTDGADACAVAEQGLVAIIGQLTHYAPLRKLPQTSALRIDPCSVVDLKLVAGIAGDPAKRTFTPHGCYVDGVDGYVTVQLVERTRPDGNLSTTANHTMQVGSYTAYFETSSEKIYCDLKYLIRPTTGDKAEVLEVSIRDATVHPNACDKAGRMLATVIPQLPKP